MMMITKTTDLLLATRITDQLAEFGEDIVINEVKKWVVKCSASLDIAMDQIKIETLAEDMVAKYPQDSLEDLRETLIKGRRGYFKGKDKKTYGKLNMEVISEWMDVHLEDKAIARENEQRQSIEPEHKVVEVRLIDIIDEKRKEILAKETDGTLTEKEVWEYLEMKEDLNDKSKAYQEELKQAGKKNTEYRKFKVDYIVNAPEAREIEQWKIMMPDILVEDLRKLWKKTTSNDLKKVIEKEIERRKKNV
jgi:hypothetical protein